MSYDGDVHETRRNVLLAAGVTVAAVAVLAVLFWFIGSMQGPKLTAGTPAAATTSTAPPTTAGTPSSAPSETTTGPPTIETWTPTTTFSLPPPDAPVAQDPGTPDAPVTSNTPPPAPQPTQPSTPRPTQAPQTQQPPAPAPSTNDAAPSISNVNLTCSQDNGRKVTATLSFTSTTRVPVTLNAGGDSQRGQAGPGSVSLSAEGRGTPLCFARVGNQIVGPVPAT